MKELLKAKSSFRKLGVILVADRKKDGMGGSWRFAGEDNLIKVIQQPLVSCGLEVISTIKGDSVVVTLWHVDSGESIESSINLSSVAPRKDKNGNEMYLDAEIERGKQFGYWSRMLTIRILGLSDIDPEDIGNRPINMNEEPPSKEDSISTERLMEKLLELIGNTPDQAITTNWILNTFKVGEISELPEVYIKQAIRTLEQKAKKDSK